MTTQMPKEYLVAALPSGNASEFPGIEAYLDQNKVEYEVALMKNGGRMYRIPLSEAAKLPRDEYQLFLPISTSLVSCGHQLYKASENPLWEDLSDLVISITKHNEVQQ